MKGTHKRDHITCMFRVDNRAIRDFLSFFVTSDISDFEGVIFNS
jgi:hypothetical protein